MHKYIDCQLYFHTFSLFLVAFQQSISIHFRIASFEREQKIQSEKVLGPRPTTPETLSPEVELQVENHKELLRKNYKDKSDYFVLELSKHYHERKLNR